jgi:hypothetical protein
VLRQSELEFAPLESSALLLNAEKHHFFFLDPDGGDHAYGLGSKGPCF